MRTRGTNPVRSHISKRKTYTQAKETWIDENSKGIADIGAQTFLKWAETQKWTPQFIYTSISRPLITSN